MFRFEKNNIFIFNRCNNSSHVLYVGPTSGGEDKEEA